jgi:hypothetical protein
MLEARLLLSIFVALSVAFSISACNSQGEDKPASTASITVKPGKDDISSEVHYENDKTIVDLRSESGIGSVDMSYNPGSQSSELILQLHLKGLENLRIQAADTTVEASVSSSHPHEIRQSAGTGNGGLVEINPADPLWLDITIANNDAAAQGDIPLEDGYFQVVVPAEIFSGEPDPAEGHILSVSWIDFYR